MTGILTELVLMIAVPAVLVVVLGAALWRWVAGMTPDVNDRIDVLLACGHVRERFPTTWEQAPAPGEFAFCNECEKARETEASWIVQPEDIK